MASMPTVNIGAAADRAERLLEWPAGRPEEVLLISETSGRPGTALLLDWYRAAGHAVIHTPAPGDCGTALISLIQVLDHPTASEAVSISGRLAAAVLDTRPQLCVAAVCAQPGCWQLADHLRTPAPGTRSPAPTGRRTAR
ncbi:hypothetical protein Acsp03_67070 [Actinomadura sp. NBRC 104412]|uniref:hypothetical protein n=1 Tax=Actinomadura sp. NBRC 104412 TaxID=3032203 RepID=UPI0024A27114|nr:hypothetical protein [Actinomadura sp. NBRC 104412]GLZ09241.1 hypothetical protein Acsp03_67070 [Actinomadura sp. NBRC 104412]